MNFISPSKKKTEIKNRMYTKSHLTIVPKNGTMLKNVSVFYIVSKYTLTQ